MNPMINRLLPVLRLARSLTALLLLVAPVVIAADNDGPVAVSDRYEVEMIIFSRTDGAGGSAERLRQKEPDLAAASEISEELLPLAAAQLRMGGAAAAIRRSPGQTLLFHGGWIQTLARVDGATRVEMPAPARNAGLAGTVKLWRERFLHAELELALRAADGALAPRTLLRQHRRLRSGEVHYFDHPALSVLLTLRLVTVPPATDAG